MEHINDPVGGLVLGSVVFGVTTVVSGSMVIMVYALYYMEELGRCEDCFLEWEDVETCGVLT